MLYTGCCINIWRIRAGKLDTHTQTKRNLDIELTLLTKINSKQITDLNAKHKIMKLLDGNIEYLDDLGCGDDLLDTIPKSSSMKEMTDKLDFIKILKFCIIKDTAKRMKRQA